MMRSGSGRGIILFLGLVSPALVLAYSHVNRTGFAGRQVCTRVSMIIGRDFSRIRSDPWKKRCQAQAAAPFLASCSSEASAQSRSEQAESFCFISTCSIALDRRSRLDIQYYYKMIVVKTALSVSGEWKGPRHVTCAGGKLLTAAEHQDGTFVKCGRLVEPPGFYVCGSSNKASWRLEEKETLAAELFSVSP